MEKNLIQPVPVLNGLPVTLPREGAVDIELDHGMLIFRVSQIAQERIEDLLLKQRESGLTSDEEQELDQYEEVDDYLSYLNRLIRNLVQAQQQGLLHAS